MSARAVAFKIDAAQAQGAIHKVNVTFGETRKGEFAARVDHFRADAAIAPHFLIAAHGNDLAFANSDALGPRFVCVQRVDLCVPDHDVRRSETHGLLGGGGRSDTENKE